MKKFTMLAVLSLSMAVQTQQKSCKQPPPPPPVGAGAAGMSFESTYPLVPIGVAGKGVGHAWAYLEPAKGQFNWKGLDAYVALAQVHKVPSIFTFVGVPKWAATADAFCGASGCSGPPANQQDLLDFAHAVFTHYPPGTFAYVEYWNEPWGSRIFWIGTDARLVQQSATLRATVQPLDHAVKFVAPGAATGDNWQQQVAHINGWLAAGGAALTDIGSYHAYPVKSECTTRFLDCAGTPLVEQAQAIKAAWMAAGITQVISTEGGWGEDSNLPDGDKPAYAARWLLLMAGSNVQGVWYAWQAQGKPQAGWGTLWDGNAPQPASVAFQTVQGWLAGAPSMSCTPTGAGTTVICAAAADSVSQRRAIVWDTSATGAPFPTSGYTSMEDVSGAVTAPLPPSVQVGQSPILFAR